MKQDGEKISGTYHGLKGPGDIAGTSVQYLTIEPGSGGGPFKVRASRRAEPVKRLEEGKMYGTNAVIADGGSKSYSLEAALIELSFSQGSR